jgi:alkylation response protein AidB-like acyl-CoA dehydrogenase
MRKIDVKKTNVSPLTHLKENEERFRTRTRKFAETQMKPLVLEMDQKGCFDESLIGKLFEQGLMSITVPYEYGGGNGTFFETIIAIEELARIDPSVSVCVDVHNTLVINAILNRGSEEQKQRFLPMLAKDTIGAFSITEKTAGSDAYALSCRAEKIDGGYRLTGEKDWVTNCAEAGIILIFAKVYQENPDGDITAFLLEKNEAAGLTVEERQDKMGIRASSTCGLALEDVFIPGENLLGDIGQGGRVALETLVDGRIGIAAQMLGLAQGALEAARDHAQTRQQFGRPIGSFQGVHFPLAEMATEIEAARLLVYNAARIKTCHSDFGERFYSSSMAKLFASKVAEGAASKAVDILGGTGFIKGSLVEKFYRDAKIGKIYEGTSNMQLRSIARAFLHINIKDEINSE